jgi:hypothetical protein
MSLDVLKNWRSLTQALIQIKPAKLDRVMMIFKPGQKHATQTIDFDQIVGAEKLAPFVSPIDGGVVVSKLGKTTRTVKAPRIRMKKQLTPSDFQERPAGGTVYVGAGDYEQGVREKIALEQLDLKERALRRLAWMCWKALTGTISVVQENIAFQIDYGVPADNKKTLTSTARWGESAADIVANIQSWIDLGNRSGYTMDQGFMGTKAADLFIKNSDVRAEIDNRKIEGGMLVLDGSDYIGRFRGVNFYRVSDTYVDDTGTVQKMVNDYDVIITSQSAPFTLEYGAVQDIKAGGNVATDWFSKMYEEEDPSALWLLVETNPLPVIKKTDALVYAVVHD